MTYTHLIPQIAYQHHVMAVNNAHGEILHTPGRMRCLTGVDGVIRI